MKISAMFYNAITGEFLEGLEWSESQIRFSNYHYQVIKRHIHYCLDDAPFVTCKIKVNDKLVLTASSKVWNGFVETIFFGNSAYHKTPFRVNKWILSESTIRRYDKNLRSDKA